MKQVSNPLFQAALVIPPFFVIRWLSEEMKSGTIE